MFAWPAEALPTGRTQNPCHSAGPGRFLPSTLWSSPFPLGEEKGCAPLPPISTFHPSAQYTELCVRKEGEILPASFAVAPLLGSQSSASVSSPDSSDPGKADRLKNHWGEDSRGELEVEKPVPPAAGSPLFPAFNRLRPRSILPPCGFSASSQPSVWLGSGPEPLPCPATLSSPALGLRVGLMEAATWELCLQ